LYGDQKARAVVVFEHVLDQSVGQAAPTSRLRIRTAASGFMTGKAPSYRYPDRTAVFPSTRRLDDARTGVRRLPRASGKPLPLSGELPP
jgi:hypothetical protein